MDCDGFWWTNPLIDLNIQWFKSIKGWRIIGNQWETIKFNENQSDLLISELESLIENDIPTQMCISIKFSYVLTH